MKMPIWLRKRLSDWAFQVIASREPDFTLTEGDRTYMLRWHVIPPNPVLSLYVHMFVGPDVGRHLHDHRSGSLSLILDGGYTEAHSTPMGMVKGVAQLARREARDVVYRPAHHPHMITHTDGAVTIFITGPTWRNWGFWVDGRWVSHKRYFVTQATGPK